MTRTRWLALALSVGLVTSQAAGCRLVRLTGSNVALLFRAPDPAPGRTSTVVVPGARIAATWIGQATVLLQLDDRFVLTDPIFTEYAGSITHRLVEPGLTVDQLPPLAAVLVSHRHVDHLSPESLAALGAKANEVIVPPGAAEEIHPGPYRVRQLARWETEEVEGLRITAVPVDHNGGRIFDRASHPLAFTGFVVEYRDLAVYFAGDTAFAPEHFRAVAERFPRIDLALLPIGPIEPRSTTHPNHIDPTDALEAARLLGAAAMLPIHHDTFVHSYDAPGDCVGALRAALASSSTYPADRVHVLQIGEQWTFEPGAKLGDLAQARKMPTAPVVKAGAAASP